MGETAFTTPLARWARAFEILVPAYMFGKSYGIADAKTVALFRAEFPSPLIDAAEALKAAVGTQHEALGRLIATTAGALVGFGLVVLLAVAFHLVLRDRRFVDSLRFTAVSLIPIAVLNGTLSHAVKTLLENMGTQSVEALTNSALRGPLGMVVLFSGFYMTGLWMLSTRTGAERSRRFWVLSIGVGFMALYFAAGLTITSNEWQALLPELQRSLAQ